MSKFNLEFKTQEENKYIQELLFQLGYEWKYRNIGKNFHPTHPAVCFLFADDGCITTGENTDNGRDYFKNRSSNKEIDISKLEDLVVLKRNNINDANWETEGGDQIYKDSNDKSYIYRSDGWDELQRHEMRQAMWEKHKPIKEPQEPNLISEKDAFNAWIDGKDVEIYDESECWHPLLRDHGLCVFDSKGRVKFRLKPELQNKIVNLKKPKRIETDPVTGAVGLIYEDNKVAREVADDLKQQFGLM